MKTVGIQRLSLDIASRLLSKVLISVDFGGGVGGVYVTSAATIPASIKGIFKMAVIV